MELIVIAILIYCLAALFFAQPSSREIFNGIKGSLQLIIIEIQNQSIELYKENQEEVIALMEKGDKVGAIKKQMEFEQNLRNKTSETLEMLQKEVEQSINGKSK